MNAAIDTQVLTTHEQLCAIRGEWAQLWRATDDATPFQSPDWIIKWWEYFRADDELFVIVARISGELAGVLPLQIAHHSGRERARSSLSGSASATAWMRLQHMSIVSRRLSPSERSSKPAKTGTYVTWKNWTRTQSC